MYGNNNWNSNNRNDRYNRGDNNSRFGVGLGAGLNADRGAGSIGGLMSGNTNSLNAGNSSPVIGSQSPEAKFRLGTNNAPTGVDRFGMSPDYQQRHFGKLAQADAAYARSANDIAQTGLDRQQMMNEQMQLGTIAETNAQNLAAKNNKDNKPTVYDSEDYNTWFDDM